MRCKVNCKIHQMQNSKLVLAECFGKSDAMGSSPPQFSSTFPLLLISQSLSYVTIAGAIVFAHFKKWLREVIQLNFRVA